MAGKNIAIGVDIGGTHITAALVDIDSKTVIDSSSARAHVDAAGDVDAIIQSWADCIQQAAGATDAQQVCLAMPGPFDYASGVSLMRSQAKYEALYNLNVKKLLAASVQRSVDEIFMENDAACFLQGEVFSGAAAAHADENVIGITLGTGLGSAICKNGRSRSADKWCWPFRDSIAEEYLCTRWFVKRWKELTGEDVSGVRAIAERTESDPLASNLFTEFGKNLADFLIDFISTDNPGAIVIGGNIARAEALFFPVVKKELAREHAHIAIHRAMLGETAPLLGAVSSWLQHEKTLIGNHH